MRDNVTITWRAHQHLDFLVQHFHAKYLNPPPSNVSMKALLVRS